MPGFAVDAKSAATVTEGLPSCWGSSQPFFFAIAFIINAANVAIDNAIFSPTSLMLLGLVCLALHLSGVGTSWKYRR